MSTNSTKLPANAAQTRTSTSRRAARGKHPSDDEILGMVTPAAAPDASVAASSAEAAQVLEANPELRDAVEAAQQFRAIFPTPAAAQDAKAQLDELDAMFFSGAPADHAALAARIHELSPEAFHGLTNAMHAHEGKIAAAKASAPASESEQIGANSAGSGDENAGTDAPSAPTVINASEAVAEGNSSGPVASGAPRDDAGGINPPLQSSATRPEMSKIPASSARSETDARHAAQAAFFHSTNAAAVQKVVAAIESQVNQLLPESVSSGAKTRIVGEIYRDLDAALRGNQQLGKQLRDAFAAAAREIGGRGKGSAAPNGALLAQQAIIALVTGRARQALPSIAKRVINEWTHGVVAANRERLARHESAAKRVDIAGAGASDGVNRKPVSPRDMDYKRLSDSDILNL